MAETDDDDIATFRNLHHRVINECPDTSFAQESYWRLTNLIITADAHADRADVVWLMEQAIERYPDSSFYDRYVNRLLTILERTGNYERLLQWAGYFTENEPSNDENYLSLALTAARAAEKLGQDDLAAWYYQQVLDSAQDQNSIFFRIAHKRLSR